MLVRRINRIYGNSRPEVFCKKGVLKISQNSQENKVDAMRHASILKERLEQVFSHEISRIFKITFFNRTPTVAASDVSEVTKIFSSYTPSFHFVPHLI